VRRPGIVHRLDRDTTGVMVVAKNDQAHRHLADQFADHGLTGPLERAYQAIVWGKPQGLKGTIDAGSAAPATASAARCAPTTARCPSCRDPLPGARAL
jgi:23S rRNA-/tRNA-specific pseudouridylate synthase